MTTAPNATSVWNKIGNLKLSLTKNPRAELGGFYLKSNGRLHHMGMRPGITNISLVKVSYAKALTSYLPIRANP